MQHVLDNPAWNALISGNNQLSNGNGTIKYFDKEVSPFAGLKENTDENLERLYHLIPHNGPVGFINPVAREIPRQWEVLNTIPCLQMIYHGISAPNINLQLVPLTATHVPQMLALTKLTNPGPFALKTILFGHYYGVFDGDTLVAMAGQRMHINNYMEISAVCTHPDHLGKGYARQLLLFHIQRIIAAGGTPMLHVRHDNERAIQVYESTGFTTRTKLHFYIMKKGGG